MKRIVMLLAVISPLVPFGADANDFDLAEQCFVGFHESKEKVQKLEEELAKVQAELVQIKTDHPDVAPELPEPEQSQ